MGSQASGLDLLFDLLLPEQQGLRVEHIEVISQAPLECDQGDVVGFLRRGHRFGSEHLLLVHGFTADQLIRNAFEPVDQGLVVVGHGHVIARCRLAQLRTQATTVEYRQGDGRADAVVEFLAGQKLQRTAAGGHVAQAADQIDVGVETGMGHVDAARLGRDIPAAGDHIRALAEQLGWQCRWQFQGGVQGQARTLQLRTLARPFAHQGCELVTAQGDFFVQRIQLPMGFGQWRLRLADFEMGADAALEAPLGQFENLLLLPQSGLDDIAQGIVQGQPDIHPHNVVL
ncbi:hypothetical protein D9M71_440670 [compost metagenome]